MNHTVTGIIIILQRIVHGIVFHSDDIGGNNQLIDRNLPFVAVIGDESRLPVKRVGVVI